MNRPISSLKDSAITEQIKQHPPVVNLVERNLKNLCFQTVTFKFNIQWFGFNFKKLLSKSSHRFKHFANSKLLTWPAIREIKIIAFCFWTCLASCHPTSTSNDHKHSPCCFGAALTAFSLTLWLNSPNRHNSRHQLWASSRKKTNIFFLNKN